MNSSVFSRRDFLKLVGPTAFAFSGLASGQKLDPPPNILVLVFDSLSALDMSLYGFSRETTPNLSRFAEHASVFHRHYSTGNFTTPGTASLLMGLYPWTHRAINLQGYPIRDYQSTNIFNKLPTEYHRFAYTHNTLAYVLLDFFRKDIQDLLKISDLAVFSDLFTDKLPLSEFHIPVESELLTLKNFFSTNGSIFLSIIDEIQREFRINRINNSFQDQFPRGLPNCSKDKSSNAICFTVETAINWLIDQVSLRPQPYFGYVHLLPPHGPYRARQEFIGAFPDQLDIPKKPEHHFTEQKDEKALTRLRRRYNEAIAYVDSEFGRLLDFLEKTNAFENTCLIVTSDHGEINERGISGHNTPVLYEPLIRIPLIIRYPKQPTRLDIHQPTSSIDIVPTLLELVNTVPDPTYRGENLRLLNEKTYSARDIFVMEAKSNSHTGPLRKATFSLIRDQHKLIYYKGYAGFDEIYELYNLREDPEELNNIFSKGGSISKDLVQALNEAIGSQT